jgi:hypothetical protein
VRLSELLSREPSPQFVQIEGFLGDVKTGIGKQKKLDIGTVGLPFFCKRCNTTTTFCAAEIPPQNSVEVQKPTKEPLYCIIVNSHVVSIDAVVKCSICKTEIPIWFLVEIKGNNMFANQVECRILKRREDLSDKAMCLRSDAFGNYTPLLEKANVAYKEELGAGAIVYLRKMLEQITCAAADSAGISRKTAGGRRKNFQDLLREVDESCGIIPEEFSSNGYELFGELSNVLHGDYDEAQGLRDYEYLRRLVVGIMENIKNKRELAEAVGALGLNDGEQNE